MIIYGALLVGAFFVPVLFRAEFLKRYALKKSPTGDAANLALRN